MIAISVAVYFLIFLFFFFVLFLILGLLIISADRSGNLRFLTQREGRSFDRLPGRKNDACTLITERVLTDPLTVLP